MDFATVFEVENDTTNDAAAAIRSDGRLEIQPAMSAVRAIERARDLAGERFGTFRAKWRHDPKDVVVAFVAQIFVRADAGRTNRAQRWVKERSEGAESFKLCERDHISSRF